MLPSLPVAAKILFQQVGKEKHLQYSKHNEKLDNYNQPYPSSPGRHGSETIPVEPENIISGIFY